MSLKLTYMGQNDSVNATPAVPLTGDPGTDQQTLFAANYNGGVIVCLTSTVAAYVGNGYSGYAIQPTYEPAIGANMGNIIPCDTNVAAYAVAFANLLNNGGEFAGAIGPSGSKKAPVVRAMWQGCVDSQAYDAGAVGTFVIGAYLYAGGSASNGGGAGNYTTNTRAENNAAGGSSHGAAAIGICTHTPSATEPWLGVASLI